jgi:hypothetical protein
MPTSEVIPAGIVPQERQESMFKYASATVGLEIQNSCHSGSDIEKPADPAATYLSDKEVEVDRLAAEDPADDEGAIE